MDTYSVVLIAIFLVIAVLPLLNIWWIIHSFLQHLWKGVASVLFFIFGYLFYILYGLIEKELHLGVTERISDYLSYLEGRILITLICLFMGVMAALIYCTLFINRKRNSQANYSYLLLFLSFIHSALLDNYLGLRGMQQLTFYRVLPSISFVVGFGLTFALRLLVVSGPREDTIKTSPLFAPESVDETPVESDTGNDGLGFGPGKETETDEEEEIPF